jgi:hypothetical protein
MEVWRILKSVLSPIIKGKNETERRIEAITGGSITIKSADSEAGLRGAGLNFLVLDEAAMIDEQIWQAALRPTLSDKRGSALLLSTPRGRNWFYRMYLRGASGELDYQSWRFPTSTSPTVTHEEIEAARNELPENIFHQEYLAEFTEDGGTVFRNVRDRINLSAEHSPILDSVYVMGVDWAQINDWTVLTVMNAINNQVVDIQRFNQVSWHVQRNRISALADKWGVCSILAELNSIGSPNVEQLQNEGLPVVGFETTSDSKNKLIQSLVLAFERGTIGILDDDILLNELDSFEATRLPSGKWRYSAPSGTHDDMVMSLALAHWCAVSGIGGTGNGEIRYSQPYTFSNSPY